ncbi:glycosyltransferase family 4 protein [Latilactobacillus curvatus]
MKITFILPKYSNKIIGGYKVVYQYADFLSGQGHEVNIVHITNYKEHKIKKNIRYYLKYFQVILLQHKHASIKWFNFSNNVKVYFFNSVKSEAELPVSDRIIATAWYSAFFVNSLSNKFGKKYYFIQHYETWSGDKKDVDRSWKLPLKKIVIASWLNEIGNSMGVTTKIIKNFVDKKEFYITVPPESRKNCIVMLYHESKWKGFSVGLKAINIVREKYPDVRVIFFGVNKRNSQIPDYAEYYHNPSRSRLREIYNEATIFLFPSVSEGWGLTATEAMQCGAALVATNNGGVADFGYDRKTALISDINDSVGLSENITALIDNRELRLKLARNGTETVNKMTIENSGKMFEEFLI